MHHKTSYKDQLRMLLSTDEAVAERELDEFIEVNPGLYDLFADIVGKIIFEWNKREAADIEIIREHETKEYQPNYPEAADTEIIREPENDEAALLKPDALPVEGTGDDKQNNKTTPLTLPFIVFPNAMVGRTYSHSLVQHRNVLAFCKVKNLEMIGLSFDPENWVIEGMPTREGTFEVTLEYLYKDSPAAGKPFSRDYPLLVNPDPRSLWKNLPPDPSADYFKTDEDAFFEEKGKKMLAASKRGRSHAHEGKFRDDDFAVGHLTPTDWYILTVADGAGSARFARKGAEIACKESVNFIKQTLTEEFTSDLFLLLKNQHLPEDRNPVNQLLDKVLGEAAYTAHTAIDRVARQNNATSKDYATTLLIAICKKFDLGYFIASFWIGDGGIGVYMKNNHVKILGSPDGGEFAGQTRFLTMKEILAAYNERISRIQFDIVEDFTALILMTDGITDAFFPTEKSLGQLEKWDDFWHHLSQEVPFEKSGQDVTSPLLSWLNFWSPGNHDDRTIAILY